MIMGYDEEGDKVGKWRGVGARREDGFWRKTAEWASRRGVRQPCGVYMMEMMMKYGYGDDVIYGEEEGGV